MPEQHPHELHGSHTGGGSFSHSFQYRSPQPLQPQIFSIHGHWRPLIRHTPFEKPVSRHPLPPQPSPHAHELPHEQALPEEHGLPHWQLRQSPKEHWPP